MEYQYYEKPSNFSPIYNTAIALMRERGFNYIYDIIEDAKISVVNTDYDNWNGGTYGYTVNFNISVKKYSTLSKEKIGEIEKIINDSLNEVNGDDNSYFHVKIIPMLSSGDLNWEAIGGLKGKETLKQKIETVRNIMISVATNGSLIKDEEVRFKKLQNEVISECKKVNLNYSNFYDSLWDWRGKWKADFPTYQERRAYINELFAPTLLYFDEQTVSQNIETIVELDDWERIQRTVDKIQQERKTAKDEEDFQKIGLLCRDVILSLAKAVYNPLIHGETDEQGIKIGPSDSVRMLANYINHSLHGGGNKILRQYAKATNDMANQLTHKRNATQKDMLLVMSATIALINLIGIIEDKI